MDKRKDLKSVNYYYITDHSIDISPSEQVKTALKSGVKLIQFRGKNLSDREMYEQAKEIKEIISNKAIFIVNDRIDIALAVDADGVHLGQDDIPPKIARELLGDKIIGISTHSLEQAKEAENIADYIGVGPVHPTSTKEKTAEAIGIEGVSKISREVDAPTAAIGGIKFKDLKPLLQHVDMICAISSVTKKGNLEEWIDLFESTIKNLKEDKHGDKRDR